MDFLRDGVLGSGEKQSTQVNYDGTDIYIIGLIYIC